jgi:ABC-type multidrug transport system fused ATPase/permease subunit
VLTIKDLRLRYRPGLPLALRGVNVTIQAGERIGVVGRTGAGKSSIMTALLRTTEPEQSSRVLLDNQDCRHLGTHALRSRAFNLIPQDAVVFSGTIRFNLDPTAAPNTTPGIDVEAATEGGKSGKSGKSGKGGKNGGGFLQPQKLHHVRPQPDSRADGAPTCSSGGGGGGSSGHGDDALMRALRKVGLEAFVRSKEEGLEFDVGEGGSLLSHGQRQLLVIARALLRPGRILLVDEATSSVDLDTDAKIQTLLRVHFREVRCNHTLNIHSVYYPWQRHMSTLRNEPIHLVTTSLSLYPYTATQCMYPNTATQCGCSTSHTQGDSDHHRAPRAYDYGLGSDHGDGPWRRP